MQWNGVSLVAECLSECMPNVPGEELGPIALVLGDAGSQELPHLLICPLNLAIIFGLIPKVWYVV